MTRVRKAAAAVLMTPLAATAVAISGSTNAQAAGCVGFGSATITPPSGPVVVGSSVALKATVHNMLLQAHLQISGPGLNQQVGKSAFNGAIGDSVTVSQPGHFSLAVIGNATQCTYVTSGFTVKERPASPRPTHGTTPHKTLLPSHGGVGMPGSSSPFPGITPGAGGAGFTQKPFNGSSPFNLPQVAPDGSAPGFQYPTPDPQVASPPARPLARNVSQTTPIKWGQSLALALVLLLLSAHLGMWSRRQRRLAAAGPSGPRGGAAGAEAAATETPDGDAAVRDQTGGRRSSGRTYHGRRRRG